MAIKAEDVIWDDKRIIPNKVKWDKPGLITPAKETILQMLSKNLMAAGKETYAEGIAPWVHGASALAFGVPKATAEMTGTRKLIYPEQKSLVGKGQRFVAEATGLLGGGAVKAGLAAAKLPFLAGKSLLKKIARSAVLGGTAGALQTPERSGIPLLAPKERLEQAAVGAGLGALVPPVSTGIEGVKRGIGYMGKTAAGYVNAKIVPKANQMYQEAVNKFTPEIQKFAREKLKIPEGAINTIKTKGVNAINAIGQKYGNSTDVIFQKIGAGFERVRKFADDAYDMAMNNAPEGKQINIRPAIEQAGNKLKRLGLITNKGKLTELGQSEIAQDNVYGKLLDFYKSANAISGVGRLQGRPLTQPQMIKVFKAMRGTKVNKEQYTFLRDKLNSLYKNKPSDVDVGRVVNQFYADGEASGIKGLQMARKLQRESFRAEGKFMNKSGELKAFAGEKKLLKFHELSKEQIRQLKKVEDYIGENFIDDLDALTSKQYLDELAKHNQDVIAQDLNRAIDPNWTKHIQQKYESLLGKDKAKQIFDEVIAHRRGVKIKKGALVGAGIGVAGGGLIGGARKKLMGGD